MPEIRVVASWRDPRWRTSCGRLTAHQQLLLQNSLRELLSALKVCRDPLLDGSLAAWSPSRWDPPFRHYGYGQWIEYRLGDTDNRARAIVCFDRKSGAIYLVARTAIHDHAALREMVAVFRPDRVLDIGEASPVD